MNFNLAEDFALNQIQLDAYCTMVWRRYEATFKLWPVIPIFERNEMTECPRKPQQLTSIGIIWNIQPFSTVSTQCLVSVFLPFMCLLPVFFPGDSQLFEEDTTISGCFSVWIMWTGTCRHVLRSTETFQLLDPFSSFILQVFCFLTEHSPSLWNWIMGSLAVTNCWFAVSHCALNNSLTTSSTLLCHHVYIWSIVDMQISHGARYPNHFHMKSTDLNLYIPIILGWLHSVGDHMQSKKRNDIASGYIAIKDFHDNLIGSISFHCINIYF